MNYESPREEQCPKCGMNFKMPQEYGSSQKPHPPMRQCSCAPDSNALVVCIDSQPLQSAFDVITNKLNEQAKFIRLLLTMVPRGVSTPDSYSPPWVKAVDESDNGGQFDLAKLPDEFIQRMVACADTQNSSRPQDQGSRYTVCLICGNSNEIERTNTATSEIGRINICYSCGVIQKTQPDVFSWVWRIIRWHYYAWAVKVPVPGKEPLGRNIITE
jgi:hypothetical protein